MLRNSSGFEIIDQYPNVPLIHPRGHHSKDGIAWDFVDPKER